MTETSDLHKNLDCNAEFFQSEVGNTNNRVLLQNVGVRPMVNPQAEGYVDPNLYPQPKEATHKIRGKNDFIEYIFGAVDQELLTVKTFYFFFYSAFGSLFPLMGVYFKQMGMNAGQCGLLIGLRPFIEFLSAPFWGSWADRWQKGKLILLASLSCWIIFTLPLGFIQPPATSCMIYENYTYSLNVPDSHRKNVKRSITFGVKKEQYISEGNLHNKLGGIISSRIDFKHINNNNVLDDNLLRLRRSDLNESYEKKAISEDYETINLEELRKRNRPADIRVYKQFLKNELLEKDCLDKEPPKKEISISKSQINRSPIKILTKRQPNTQLISEKNHSNLTSNTRKRLLYSKNKIEKYFNQYQSEKEKKKENLKEDTKKIDFSSNRGYTEEENINFKRIRRNAKLQVPSVGQSPLSVSYASNYNEQHHKEWVKPIFSTIVYQLSDIQKTFFLLLLLVVVGEFFSAPAITLADSAVITLLGEDADRYGHQRMFGSLGWGLAMFFVGIALDHSTAFPDHPCGPDAREKNYTICFAIFSVLMGAALITATQINFKYDAVVDEPEVQKLPTEPTREEQLQSQLSQQLNLPGLQDSTVTSINQKLPPLEGKTKMFAQTTREIPEWITVLKHFKDLKCASFLFVAWFMGFGIGLIFTFLFWHLQDYGGTPTLFGVASVINHISEIFAYFFSFKLIRQIGHVKVLCLGLGGNVLRFLYISWLKNPWWVLPFEFMQGITHAAVWAACCSYIAHNTPTALRSNAQAVLQGLHHGLGRGCGAVIGGLFVSIYGTTSTFRAYGLICLIVLVAFIFINFYRKDTGFVSDLPQTEDPHQVAEVTHLAPHGVPSNAIPRALSSNRLHELSNQDANYGATYQSSDGSLNIPTGNAAPANPNNPFLKGTTGREYNYQMSDNDDFIRRSFQIYSEIVDSDFDLIKNPPIITQLHTQQPCTNPFHQHNYEW